MCVGNVVTSLGTLKEPIAASACDVLLRGLEFLTVILGYESRGCKRKLPCPFCLLR